MTENEFEQTITLITQKTGIIPRETHKMGIRNSVEKYLAEKNMSFAEYFSMLKIKNDTLEELINLSTVNETYFFREENQFLFLEKNVFPMLRLKKGKAPVRIWSAACSGGEEPYSLALLTDSRFINAEITASDINTKVLNKCKAGVYSVSAIRNGDGENYRHLLEQYISAGQVVFPEKIKSKIRIQKINLIDLPKKSFPIEKQDIIFLRNVFIYFSRETKAQILENICSKYLADGGILMVSTNEIALIDSEITPPELEKKSFNSVFYFKKKEQ